MSRFSFSNEPAVWIGAITAVAMVAADYGFHLSTSQVAHLIDAVPFVAAIIVRHQVTPTSNVPEPVGDKPLADQLTEALDAYKAEIEKAQAGIDSIRNVAASVVTTPPVTPASSTGTAPFVEPAVVPTPAVAPEVLQAVQQTQP